MKPTPHQIELMEHAVGFTSKNPGYRNYFAATPYSKDDQEWIDISNLGYAKLYQTPNSLFPYNCYVLTNHGKEFLEFNKLNPAN